MFGILVLAWVAGLGGGIIRDLFLGITPPVAVTDWQLLAAAVAAAVLVFLLHGRWEEVAARAPDVRWRRLPYAVRLLDAGGLAIFAVNGALVALSLDAGALAATLIGGITAVGGGVMRDVLAGRVPEVLQRELYALPALFGAALVVLADYYGVTSRWTIWGSVALVFAIRVLAVALDLNAPTALRTTRTDARPSRRQPTGGAGTRHPRIVVPSALPVSSSRRKPASSRMVSPSSRALSSLVPAFSPTTT